MTNKEHTTLRNNLTLWSTEDLHMVKNLVEVEIMERECGKPEFQEWMRNFIEEMNASPTYLKVINGGKA